ncbi:heart- and neural crest derivatives-expressed protein 2-like [Anopheles nili]|uniref:heart- and neural crest derivatives-expressed protein 2-like n=1 Tax=Anopheles nili TaxID=185578 RepID=UPI00237B25D2|nr:heart- and neural crest derivatives-expressed protein 2-like [Anopheles nili]
MYNKMSSYESASPDGDLCHRVCEPDPYYESNGGYYTQLYPADSQHTGNQVTSGGGGVIIMDEEGYWGSPCSSSESHPDPHRDRYASPSSPAVPGTLGPPTTTTVANVGTTLVLNSGAVVRHHGSIASSADQSSLSSASSTTSTSSSASSSPYGTAGHQHQHVAGGGGGAYHQHRPHPQHEQQQQQQQHHHQQLPSSMYCSSMVYDKSAAVYVPDEGYYGGGASSTIDLVSGTSTSDHQGHLHLTPSSSGVIVPGVGGPVVRVVKRRNTANKKERRRTQSINSAYTSLRDRIPNVPNDTKLSKIKTLRLAISYIAHLLAVVNGNQDPSCDFRAELVPSSRKINAERRAQKTLMQNFSANGTITSTPATSEGRKIKGRTGWPQHVWALETKTTIK